VTKLNKKTEKQVQENEFIVQHNNLIEARYHLTLQEKRLMCWLASQVQPTDKDFKEHELSIKDFASLINVRGDHLYNALNSITHKLMQKIITIRELKKKGFTKAALLGGAKYYEGDGVIKLSFHPYLKPYMLQLSERFTKISLGDIMGLKSIHAIRIYELLKQYENIGKREISLEDLRTYCGIEEKKYKNINDLKRFLLEISKKEINNKTDIFIDYKSIKNSRKINAFQFIIKPNKKHEVSHLEKSQVEKAVIIEKELRNTTIILEQLREYGFTKQAANRLIKKHEQDDITNTIKAVDIYRAKNDVKNAKALIETAIKEKWHPERFQIKTTKKKS